MTTDKMMRFRLSLLMFLQYSVLGAWIPLFSLWLTQLELSPFEMSWVFATFAMSSVLGPLIVGQIADRWVAVERCIAVAATIAGLALFLLSNLTEPWPVFAACLLHSLFMVSAVTLGTTLCFRQLQAPDRDFGPVRLWGTVGWIVPGVILGAWFRVTGSDLADSLRLAGILALALGAYALTLPHTPPLRPEASAQRGFASGWISRLFDAP